MKKQADTNKADTNKANQSESTLYSIYGARLSKSGERVNVSLLKGEDDNKQWACVSVKLKGNGKIKAKIQDGFAFIKIPILEKDECKKDVLDF